MTRLYYLILLAVLIIGFGNQRTNAQASELPNPQIYLDPECIGSVDPLNPSPLAYTERVILAVTCMNQENSQETVSTADTLTITDLYILYWTPT